MVGARFFAAQETVKSRQHDGPDDQSESVEDRDVQASDWGGFHLFWSERIKKHEPAVHDQVDREQDEPDPGIPRLHEGTFDMNERYGASHR